MVNNLILLSANRYSRAALKVISENGNNLIDCLAIFMRYSKTGEEDGFEMVHILRLHSSVLNLMSYISTLVGSFV